MEKLSFFICYVPKFFRSLPMRGTLQARYSEYIRYTTIPLRQTTPIRKSWYNNDNIPIKNDRNFQMVFTGNVIRDLIVGLSKKKKNHVPLYCISASVFLFGIRRPSNRVENINVVYSSSKKEENNDDCEKKNIFQKSRNHPTS